MPNMQSYEMTLRDYATITTHNNIDTSSLKEQITANAHLLTANRGDETWTRANDDRLTGIFEVVTLLNAEAAFVATLVYYERGLTHDFIASGLADRSLGNALNNLLTVVSQGLTHIRDEVIEYGANGVEGLREVSGEFVRSGLV